MTDNLTSIRPDSPAAVLTDNLASVLDEAGQPIVEAVLPADSAFVSGICCLPDTPPEVPDMSQGSSLTADILAIGSLLITILLLKKIVNIFPSLIACALRWKESCNLEASVKLSRDRDIIAFTMIIPFCLVVEHFQLYRPGYMDGLRESLRIAATAATFVTYIGVRLLAIIICRPKKSTVRTFATGCKASATFFILLTFILLIMGGVSGFIDLDPEFIKPAMLWVSAGVYVLFLIRSVQIFASSCSLFTAFLYLCALEIVPTGLLVGSVFVF
ncbi:MAG: hypothetical protein ACI3ZL_01750 [Candidatus Cryptobacteroides sp.]